MGEDNRTPCLAVERFSIQSAFPFRHRLTLNNTGHFGRHQSSPPPNPTTAVTATAAITTAMIVAPVAATRLMTATPPLTFCSWRRDAS